MTSVDLHLTPLFTEINKIAPPKPCLKSSPARNEFRATLFLLSLKKFPWKSFGVLVASVNGKNCPKPLSSSGCDFKELSKQLSLTMSIREHPEERLWTNLTIPSAIC